MITIHRPKIIETNGKKRLIADIELDGNCSQLWFEVDAEYGQYLCHERSDAFVLGLLHYAMRYGHDITCMAPMTKRLHEQITGQFLAPFLKLNCASRESVRERHGRPFAVKVLAPLGDEVEHPVDGNAIGTGVSCGVDSLHVFATHPDITHGCIWNGHGVNHNETAEMRADAWGALVARAKQFTDYIGVKLIVGNTNYDRGCLPELMWDGMVTNGNLFCAYCMQKFWAKYYVASLCDIHDFRMKQPMYSDPAHYEYYLFSFASIGRIAILLDGVAHRRVEKVADLSRYEPAKKFLNTCWGIHDGHRNCSYLCPKCMRTMLDLYCNDALVSFSAVYDVDYFNRHLEQYVAEFYRGCIQNDIFMLELKPYMARKNIPLLIKAKAIVIVARKMVKKLLRRGRVNCKFSPRG